MESIHAEQKEYWHQEKHAKRRDPRHPVVRMYVEPKIQWMKQHIDAQDIHSIMDIGAGNGYFSYHLESIAPVTAVDYSSVILEGNPVENKVVMDARALEFTDNQFDLGFCHAVLHHIDKNDQLQVVSEMARASKKYVVLMEPNRNNPVMTMFGALKKEEHGLLRFTPGYTADLLKKAGLELVAHSAFGCITPNRMPIPQAAVSSLGMLERPWPLGITTIAIGKKK